MAIWRGGIELTVTELFQERRLAARAQRLQLSVPGQQESVRIRDLAVRAVRGKWTALLVREIKVGNFALQVLVVVLGASHRTDFGSLSVLMLKLSCPRKNKANKANNRGTATSRRRLRNAVTARHFTS
jgi:hypothetical protein